MCARTQAQTYCTPAASCSYGDRIDAVTINGTALSSNPVCSSNGYSYQMSSAILFAGQMNTFVIQLQNSTYDEGVAIWVDFNKDGDFDDSGEKIYQTPALIKGSNGAITLGISTPVVGASGYYRLRIRVKYNNNTVLPCETYTYGETEDYLINILSSTAPSNDLIVEQTTIQRDTTINGVNSVTARNNAVINASQKDVYFVGGKKVVLEPGTDIKPGTNFTASIENENKESGASLLVLKDSSEYKFLPLNTRLTFRLYNANFFNDSTLYSLKSNGTARTISHFIITDSTLSFKVTLNEGLNNLLVDGRTTDSSLVSGEFGVWAGNRTVTVTVTDAQNNLVPGASVLLELSDDKTITAQGVTSPAGEVVFANITQRTVIATALKANKFGTLAIAVTILNNTSATVVLKDLDPPSPVNNNDFSQQTAGWNIGNAPVSIIPHTETNLNSANIDNNYDLQLSTAGIGPQFISRSFTIQPGTKQVTVRYRFITSEVPGGYFGSRYNDYFAITIRTQVGAQVLNIVNGYVIPPEGISTEQNSMNGLGLAAFDANGRTAWREVTLPVSENGDVVQVEATVANVADGLYGSQVVIDVVKEGKFKIQKVVLQEKRPYTWKGEAKPIHDNPIRFISLDAHTYFNSKTQIMGSLKLTGEVGDKVADLRLVVYKGNTVIATGVLVNNKLKQPFGNTGIIEIPEKNPELLFEIPAGFYPFDKELHLRIEGETIHGESTPWVDLGTLKVLKRYLKINRYGGRDEDLGGDDWIASEILLKLYTSDLISKWSVGDIANMNGGYFPPHSKYNAEKKKGGTHERGRGVDIDFGEFSANPAIITKKKTAQSLLALLNTTLVNDLDKIIVTFQKPSPFWNEIKDSVLANGEAAADKIVYDKGHADHCHLSFKEGSTTTSAALMELMTAKRENFINRLTSQQANDNRIKISVGKSVIDRYNDLKVLLKLDKEEQLSVQFEDMKGIAGEAVFTGKLNKGEHIFTVPASQIPNAGEYLLLVKTGSGISYASFTKIQD
jgi:hypothetical protein